jgi:hypothetical protein
MERDLSRQTREMLGTLASLFVVELAADTLSWAGRSRFFFWSAPGESGHATLDRLARTCW